MRAIYEILRVWERDIMNDEQGGIMRRGVLNMKGSGRGVYHCVDLDFVQAACLAFWHFGLELDLAFWKSK